MLHLFNTKEESTYIRLLSSALSGVAVAVCSLPFDNIKTKLMRMKKSIILLIQIRKEFYLTKDLSTASARVQRMKD